MSPDDREYHSHSPEEWEKIDAQKKKKPKKTISKTGLIVGINFIAILAILLFYFEFNGNPAVKSSSLATVGNFQIYISSSKDSFLSGEPLNFMVYLTNLSSERKNFEIYSFGLKITQASTLVYVFNTSNVIKSEAEPKSTVLLYELKDEANLTNLAAGLYKAEILMNLDGKEVSIEKSFKYASNISAFITSENDFLVEGQKENFTFYVQNNTPKALQLNVHKIIFSVLNDKGQIIQNKGYDLNSTFSMQPGQEALAYDYSINPIQNPGYYYITGHLTGSQDLNATSLISVVNEDVLNDSSGINIISSMPLYVNSKSPVSFSVSLVDNDVFNKKYVVLNSLTIIVKKGNVEIYRFSNDTPHNIKINPGGTRSLFDSKSWQTLIFPEKGTYDFEVIAKIGNNFISYNKKIQSS